MSSSSSSSSYGYLCVEFHKDSGPDGYGGNYTRDVGQFYNGYPTYTRASDGLYVIFYHSGGFYAIYDDFNHGSFYYQKIGFPTDHPLGAYRDPFDPQNTATVTECQESSSSASSSSSNSSNSSLSSSVSSLSSSSSSISSSSVSSESSSSSSESSSSLSSESSSSSSSTVYEAAWNSSSSSTIYNDTWLLGFTIVGAGSTIVNDNYCPDGIHNGRTAYINLDGTYGIRFGGGSYSWTIYRVSDSALMYVHGQVASEPPLTGWTAQTGQNPAPTLEIHDCANSSSSSVVLQW